MSISERLQSWMDGYRRAWASNDEADIRALFTPDADYLTEPYSPPWHGADAIVAGWRAIADEPDDHAFEWAPTVDEPELAVVEGTTRYADGKVYRNLWVVRFDGDGRATHFTEWYMRQPR